MSQLDSIKKEIIADAQKEAEQMIDELKAELEEKRRTDLSNAKNEAELRIERARKQAPLIRERARSSAERQAANILLAAKQELIDRVFKLTEKKLMDLSDREYNKLLQDVISKGDFDKESVIEIQKGRKIDKIPYRIEEHKDLKSGFRIRHEGIKDNYDYVELLRYLRSDLSGPLIQKLEEELKK